MTGGKWSREDIVELVALLVGIPAAIGAIVMLAAYFRSRQQVLQGRRGSDRAETYSLRSTNVSQGERLQDSRSETGVTAVQYPRPVLLPAAPCMVPTWPVIPGRKAAGDKRKGRTSSQSMTPQEEACNGIDDGALSFRNEVDAHVEQERKDWAAELV